MPHKHWPKDHPQYPFAPVHDVPKAECDLHWRWYQHGHMGIPCEMEVKPGNKTATCNLVGQAKQRDDDARRKEWTDAYERFIQTEQRRIVTLLRR